MAVAVANVVQLSDRTRRQLQQIASQRAAQVSALAEQILREFVVPSFSDCINRIFGSVGAGVFSRPLFFVL